MILRASVGLDTFNEMQTKLADIDVDGMITANDALDVLRNSVGLSSSKKIGKQLTA